MYRLQSAIKMMILAAEEVEESRILYPILEDTAETVANIADLQPPTDSLFF